MDTKKSGRRYDEQFKRDAVELIRSGKTKTEISRDLGVATITLSAWEKKYAGRSTKPVAGETLSPEVELKRLRIENDYLRRQREILKKAIAICSELDAQKNNLR